MNKLFGALIAITCLAVLAASGWYLYSERQKYLVEAKAEAQRQAVINELIKKERESIEKARKAREDSRLSSLECNAMAHQTIPDETGQPAKTSRHNADLKRCADLDRLGDYELRGLKQIGVI